jgi:hypothetical protein
MSFFATDVFHPGRGLETAHRETWSQTADLAVHGAQALDEQHNQGGVQHTAEKQQDILARHLGQSRQPNGGFGKEF